MSAKRIAKLLEQALLHNGKMAQALFEFEFEAEDLAELKASLERDNDVYLCAVTENTGDIAMVLIERSGVILANEQARDKLKEYWNERDRRARQLCIERYGARCVACGLSFEEMYGPEAIGIIHVHHIIPLSEIKESYQVDPVKDLRPVCPNCHAVIHATKPPRTIEQVAKMVLGD